MEKQEQQTDFICKVEKGTIWDTASGITVLEIAQN